MDRNYHHLLSEIKGTIQSERTKAARQVTRLEVEYALRTGNKPMGVAEYHLSHVLPEGLSVLLQSPEEIKRKFQG